MKSFLRICCVLLSVLLFSCEKDTMPASDVPNIITGQSAKVYRKGATLYGNIKNPDASPVESFGIELAIFSRPGMTIEQYFATAQSFEVDQMDAQGDFSVQVGGLEPGQTYMYRSFVNSGHNVVYGVDSTFQTPHNTAPVFGDMNTSDVSYTSFDISVTLLDDGGDPLQAMGYIYREAAEELAQEIVIGPEVKSVYCPGDQLDNQQFTLTINDLYAGRRYAVRAFAMADGIGYSEMMYVRTHTQAPMSDETLVSACDTSNALYNSLQLKASILAENKQYPVTEVGFCYSSESSEPTVTYLTLPATLSGTDFEATLTQLLSEKTYYIRAYARQSDDAYIYGEVLEYQVPYYESYVVEFDANGGEGTMEPQMILSGVSQALNTNAFIRGGYDFTGWNTSPDGSGTAYSDGQEISLMQDMTLYAQWFKLTYVDLGLPSGTKWAICNVGATTPEAYGDYFAWGETTPKNYYDWSTYKYCKGSETTFTKYCTQSNYGYKGFTDNKTTLDLVDDAARVNWGGKWRIPSHDQFEELRTHCTWIWTTQNGVNGYKVTSKSNGKSIFLPAAGYRDGTSFYRIGSYGYYWSGLLTSSQYYSRGFYFLSGYVGWDYYNRSRGFTVRAVFSDKDTPSSFVILSFDANGGEGIMEPQIFEAGVAQALNTNAFIRSGYEFAGWNTAPDGSGTSYSDGQELTLTEDMMLYAQWVKPTYVDLGLPSGTKWAICNVGASTPEGYGDYFAWGETTPKNNYDWSSYKYCKGSETTLTKYNNSGVCGYDGYTDNKTLLDLSDDAAHVNWGGKWRIPSLDQFEELRTHCTWIWTTQNGVNGYKVISKSNGKSIFMPAAGYRDGTYFYRIGSYGYYWSGLLTSPQYYSHGFYFLSGIVDKDSYYRSRGFPVRAVCP